MSTDTNPLPSFISHPPHDDGGYRPTLVDGVYQSKWMGHTVQASQSRRTGEWVAQWGGEEVHRAPALDHLHTARTLAVELARATPFPTD